MDLSKSLVHLRSREVIQVSHKQIILHCNSATSVAAVVHVSLILCSVADICQTLDMMPLYFYCIMSVLWYLETEKGMVKRHCHMLCSASVITWHQAQKDDLSYVWIKCQLQTVFPLAKSQTRSPSRPSNAKKYRCSEQILLLLIAFGI